MRVKGYLYMIYSFDETYYIVLPRKATMNDMYRLLFEPMSNDDREKCIERIKAGLESGSIPLMCVKHPILHRDEWIKVFLKVVILDDVLEEFIGKEVIIDIASMRHPFLSFLYIIGDIWRYVAILH